MAHNRDELSSTSISDRNIYNCNHRLVEPVNQAGPSKLWEVGKQVGIMCQRDEDEVVKEYGSMEDRDSGFALCSKVGSKNGS